MSRLSGPEEAIVALLKLLRGRPQDNTVETQQVIAPPQVYAQALQAVLDGIPLPDVYAQALQATVDGWRTMTSEEKTGPLTYVLPAGWYEIELWANADKSFQFEVQFSVGWKTVWSGAYRYASLSPFLSDGTNARIILENGLYARLMRMGI